MRAPALSDLSVTEFLTLSRVGFLPHGFVVGCSVYDAGFSQFTGVTSELQQMSYAMREARRLAVGRMREQAHALGAEGIVGVRLTVEHHRWRGGHNIAKFIALGTAIGFDPNHAPPELRGSPSLRLVGGQPFTSDLSGQDFVTLLRAGFRPIDLAMGNCVYEIDPRHASSWSGATAEIGEYTQAFFDARELAMDRLQADLFHHWPPGHADAPCGVVGMTVSESIHGERAVFTTRPVVEFTAVGTAVAPLSQHDPRRAPLPTPTVVVPLDR